MSDTNTLMIYLVIGSKGLHGKTDQPTNTNSSLNHSIYHYRDGGKWVIVAGEHNFGLTEGSEQVSEVIDYFDSFVHPQFDERTNENDIALVKLTEDFIFDEWTQPACIPSRGP